MPSATGASLEQELSSIERQFSLDGPKLRQIADRFQELFQLGLNEYGQEMAMVPTFGASSLYSPTDRAP